MPHGRIVHPKPQAAPARPGPRSHACRKRAILIDSQRSHVGDVAVHFNPIPRLSILRASALIAEIEAGSPQHAVRCGRTVIKVIVLSAMHNFTIKS